MVINHTPNTKTLFVFMNGWPVGQLKKSYDGALSFQYEKSWLTQKGKRPISLSLPTEPSFHSGDLVYRFFDNLLPDNPTVRAYIQQRFDVESNQLFDLLQAIGKDCIGAIQLHPEKIYNTRIIIGKPLSTDELKEVCKANPTAPLGMSKSHEQFRISLAGVQDKTGLLWHEGKWQSPRGTTPTTHIIKLPIAKVNRDAIEFKNSVDNEWLCLKLLGLYGLRVTNADYLVVDEKKVLAVERFDRRLSSDKSWIMRLPQEDMCQALGLSSTKKYESDSGPGLPEIMKLLEQSSNAEQDRADFMKANFLYWLMAASDGHAKNFSIFIEPEGRFRLTPFYDVLSMYPLIAEGKQQRQKLKMAMALHGSKRYYNWHNFQLRHIFSTAEKCNFSKDGMRHIVEYVLAQTEEVLNQAAQLLPNDFPATVSKTIFSGIKQTANRLSTQL